MRLLACHERAEGGKTMNEAATHLREQLEDYGGPVERFVLSHGRDQEGREVPSGWRRRRRRSLGWCYVAAQEWMLHDDGVTYTEGFASYHGGWPLVPHAWLTDSDGQVVDLAWAEPGSAYLGVEIPTRLVCEIIAEIHLHTSILDVLVRRNWTPGAARQGRGGIVNGCSEVA